MGRYRSASPYSENYTYFFFPKIKLVIRCAFAVLDLMPAMSTAYASFFIVVFVQVLVHAHTKFLRHVSARFSGNPYSNCAKRTSNDCASCIIGDEIKIKARFIQLQLQQLYKTPQYLLFRFRLQHSNSHMSFGFSSAVDA